MAIPSQFFSQDFGRIHTCTQHVFKPLGWGLKLYSQPCGSSHFNLHDICWPSFKIKTNQGITRKLFVPQVGCICSQVADPYVDGRLRILSAQDCPSEQGKASTEGTVWAKALLLWNFKIAIATCYFFLTFLLEWTPFDLKFRLRGHPFQTRSSQMNGNSACLLKPQGQEIFISFNDFYHLFTSRLDRHDLINTHFYSCL